MYLSIYLFIRVMDMAKRLIESFSLSTKQAKLKYKLQCFTNATLRAASRGLP